MHYVPSWFFLPFQEVGTVAVEMFFVKIVLYAHSLSVCNIYIYIYSYCICHFQKYSIFGVCEILLVSAQKLKLYIFTNLHTEMHYS